MNLRGRALSWWGCTAVCPQEGAKTSCFSPLADLFWHFIYLFFKTHHESSFKLKCNRKMHNLLFRKWFWNRLTKVHLYWWLMERVRKVKLSLGLKEPWNRKDNWVPLIWLQSEVIKSESYSLTGERQSGHTDEGGQTFPQSSTFI